jgi:cytidyltransferase-like protein
MSIVARYYSIGDWIVILIQLICWITIGAAFYLTYTIIFPHILHYPWPDNNSLPSTKRDMETTVVVAGSYNPPHLGHVQMLLYLSKRYRNVIAVIGCNPNKKYQVSPQIRADMLRQCCASNNATATMNNSSSNTSNISVEVVSGYIWKFLKQQQQQQVRHGGDNICRLLFVRGIRTWNQDGEEERLLHILNTFGPILAGPFVWPIPTLFLEGNPKYNHISSSLIRRLIEEYLQSSSWNPTARSITDLHNLITQFVPAAIASQVIEAYSLVNHEKNVGKE